MPALWALIAPLLLTGLKDLEPSLFALAEKLGMTLLDIIAHKIQTDPAFKAELQAVMDAGAGAKTSEEIAEDVSHIAKLANQ